MKKLLLLGALVSSIAMADVIEVRVGGDLTNRATFKDTDNQNWKINDDALKNGFEITGEYRTPIAENLEIGGGISYKFNKLSNKNYSGLTMKGINSVPIFFTTRYNFKNATIKVLGRELRVHDLRHSHASFLINNGVDILLISKRLGHSNTAMTLNVYSHLYPDRENEAINLINKLKANK